MAKAVLFNNFTDEDFTHNYDGDPWTFKAGESTRLQEPIALLMAKHMIDRELYKAELPFDDASRSTMISKIIIAEDVIEAESEEKLETALLNEKFVCEICGKEAKSKAGLAAPMRSHKEDKKEEKPEDKEEEFEGLK